MTDILIADDHAVVRRGLRAVLEAEREFRVVGEATTGLEAVRMAEELTPHVLILDLLLPGLHGLDVTRQVTLSAPQVKVLIMSMYSDESYVVAALRNGATGYALKDASVSELVRITREVAAGRRYLSPPLTERAIEVYVERALEGSFDPYDTLTGREREVLHLAAEGLTSAAIAERLGISGRTAEAHRANAFRKLGIHSQTELVLYAVKRGILRID